MHSVEKVKRKIPVAITIAGSDSGGGAGIQADLKTFAALGVHGTTAITSITAQNTQSVTAVEDLTPEIIREQIKVVAEDFGIDAGKTGMLHTEKIIKTVSSEVSKYKFPVVVDPVMIAKSGTSLLKPEAMDTLKNLLLTKATVITPNRFEAEKLSEMEIKNLGDAEVAARRISEMGPKAVIIKGGHLEERDAVDLLYYEGKIKKFSTTRLDVKTTHGTGCSFSAAIAAQLAKGEEIPAAVEYAKNFVTLAIKFGINVGKGYGPINALASLHREASRYQVLMNVDEARKILEASPDVVKLVPEVGMNVAMAIPYAETMNDIAALPGRLVKVSGHVKTLSCPRFGASTHLAKYLLEIMKHDPEKKAAINVKFSEETLNLLREKKLEISFYDRKEEPDDIKRVEGMTVPWGVNQALKRSGEVPDVIFHRGDIGKEPMIVILGKEAKMLAEFVTKIATEMKT